MPVKRKPNAPAKRRPRIAATVRTNTQAVFAMARRVPELADRSTPVLLSAYIKARAGEYGDTVSKSHIYRMLTGGRAVGADVLDIVARAFGLEAWHMLVPGMEPENPPSVLISDAQRRLFRNLTESYREIAKGAANGETDSGDDLSPRRDPARPTARARNVDPKPALPKGRAPKTKAGA